MFGSYKTRVKIQYPQFKHFPSTKTRGRNICPEILRTRATRKHKRFLFSSQVMVKGGTHLFTTNWKETKTGVRVGSRNFHRGFTVFVKAFARATKAMMTAFMLLNGKQIVAISDFAFPFDRWNLHYFKGKKNIFGTFLETILIQVFLVFLLQYML